MDSVEKIVAEMREQCFGAYDISPVQIDNWADRLAALAPAGVGEDIGQSEMALTLDLMGEIKKAGWSKTTEVVGRGGMRWPVDQVIGQAITIIKWVRTARPDSVSEAADAARFREIARRFNHQKTSEAELFLLTLRIDADPAGQLDAIIDAALEAARAPG